MKNKKYVIGSLVSLLGCIVTAAAMGLYPTFANTLMGVLAIVSVFVFSLCCSRWLDVAAKPKRPAPDLNEADRTPSHLADKAA